MWGEDGTAYVPTASMGIGMGVFGGAFGALWTIMTLSITGGAPDFAPFSMARVLFPLLGVVMRVATIGYGIHVYSKAREHQQAFAAYKARRARVKPE